MTRTAQPRRPWPVANIVVFQLAWFACVLGAAHGEPGLGMACVAAAVAWHVGGAPAPRLELRLVGAAVAVGVVLESVVLASHAVRYPHGQSAPWLPPPWLLAMWALFAITLNVSLRWMKRRWAVAALFGGVGAPLSFAGGVRLGAAEFTDRPRAMWVLAAAWAVAMPLLMWLSDRCDGYADTSTEPAHA